MSSRLLIPMPREGTIAILTGKKYCSHKKTADETSIGDLNRKNKKRGSHKQKCGCLFFSYKMDEMPFKNSFPDKSISESRGIFL